ncbi:MAG: GTP-binding protein [Pseudomonadota bacterium]
MDIENDRIPVTLLTGFLGAGKTTLLNKLIQDPNSGRIAVIMNEFGDVGLDHDLIEETTEEIILMQSGCLCCTFRGDIAKTLGSLMARLKRGELSFDRVVIETTGIAEPGPIMHTLVVDDLIAPYYRLDGVITVADAATGLDTLGEHTESVSQIAMADLIIITKTDLVSEEDVSRFENRIDSINASAPRIYSDHGYVPISRLFGLSALREDASSEEITQWLGKSSSAHLGTHNHHKHGKIVSGSIELWEPIPANVFDFWLDMLIALKGPDILRMKGIVHVEGMEQPFVFHGVQHIFDSPVLLKSSKSTDTNSRVVLIARNMSKEDLQTSLDMLRMQPKDVETAKEDVVAEPAEMPF